MDRKLLLWVVVTLAVIGIMSALMKPAAPGTQVAAGQQDYQQSPPESQAPIPDIRVKTDGTPVFIDFSGSN